MVLLLVRHLHEPREPKNIAWLHTIPEYNRSTVLHDTEPRNTRTLQEHKLPWPHTEGDCPPWATAVLKLSDMPLRRHMLVAVGHSRVTAVLKGLLLNTATLRRPHTSPRSSSRYAATSVHAQYIGHSARKYIYLY